MSKHYASYTERLPGMSLLDWYAGQANEAWHIVNEMSVASLKVLLGLEQANTIDWDDMVRAVAIIRSRIADAMLAEKRRREAEDE